MNQAVPWVAAVEVRSRIDRRLNEGVFRLRKMILPPRKMIPRYHPRNAPNFNGLGRKTGVRPGAEVSRRYHLAAPVAG